MVEPSWAGEVHPGLRVGGAGEQVRSLRLLTEFAEPPSGRSNTHTSDTLRLCPSGSGCNCYRLSSRPNTDSATFAHPPMSDATVVPNSTLSPTLASDLLNRFPAPRAARPPHHPVASTSALSPSSEVTLKELGSGVSGGGRKRGRGDDELLELLEAEEREQQQLMGHLNQAS